MWRLAKQSLHTEDVRAQHNMSTTSSCGLCGSHDSWIHSPLDCSMSRCVWALEEGRIVDQMIATMEPNAKLWILMLMASLSHNNFVRMGVTLWAIGRGGGKLSMKESHKAHKPHTCL